MEQIMRNLRSIFLSWLFSLLVLPLAGQEMSVKSFELRQTDIVGKVKPRYDLNDEACALIRVQVALSGVKFEGMVMGDVQEKTGEYFVYVPAVAKSIRIKADGYLPLEYHFPERLQGLRTYGLRILLPGVPDAGELPRPTAQYVVMNVQPKGAMVIIDDMMRSLDSEGNLFLELPLGEHRYQISASGYRTQHGTFPLIDTEKTVLNVALQPATGWLDLSSVPADGVQVLVDGNSVGTTPCRLQLSGGQHRLQLLKPGYLAYNETVTLVDGQTLKVQARLQINSSEVVLNAANPKAEIWVSGQKMGVGSWSGPLDAGTYTVTSRCEGYEEMVDIIEVRTGGERTFRLSEQVPVYGLLKVASQPMGADIYLDGKKIGQTPYQDSRVLTGRHTLWVVKAGYRTEVREVELKKGTPSDLTVRMSAGESRLPSATPSAPSATGTTSTTVTTATATATGESYRVGDYYSKNGLRGIVFWVDASGQHGKIVSMAEEKLSWDTNGVNRLVGANDLKNGATNQAKGVAASVPSFGYCKSQGEGWYMPAKEELIQLFKAKTKVNATLKKMGQRFLQAWYWSSTEGDNDQAWCLDMYGGVAYKRSKEVVQPVRPIAQF